LLKDSGNEFRVVLVNFS
jgi:hypothetical protein